MRRKEVYEYILLPGSGFMGLAWLRRKIRNRQGIEKFRT